MTPRRWAQWLLRAAGAGAKIYYTMKNTGLFTALLLCASAPVLALSPALDQAASSARPAAEPPAASAPAAAGRAEDPDWLGREFEAVFTAGKDFSPSELSRLRSMRLLFVPGFMSNLASDSGYLPSLPFVPEYFGRQIAYLRGRGLDCRLVDIESETSIYANARKVIKEIEQAPGKVLVIGHSKGGLDTLEALLKRPDLRRKVHAVIAVQSPFFGSPVADLMLSGPTLSVPSSLLLDMLGGSKQSLRNLSVKYRRAYHRENEAEIRKLTAQVPFYSYSTWKDDSFLPYLDTVFEGFRDYMLGLGLKNDGLVPAESAVLPGSRYVYLAGTDHLCTVLWVPLPLFDRECFVRSALKLSLKQ